MPRATLLLLLPIMIACSKKGEVPADTSAPIGAPAAAAPMNVAGMWTINVMPEAKDTILLTYTLEATNEMTGWKMTLPNREPMEPRVASIDSDSIVLDNGPYPSALRKDVMVTTHTSMRLEGDKLVGKTVARYATKGADSVVILRTEGTRK